MGNGQWVAVLICGCLLWLVAGLGGHLLFMGGVGHLSCFMGGHLSWLVDGIGGCLLFMGGGGHLSCFMGGRSSCFVGCGDGCSLLFWELWWWAVAVVHCHLRVVIIICWW